jgi:hypothetical protein
MNGLICAVPGHRCPHEDPVQLHHVLGRDEHRRYVQPVILLPLCQPGCHQLGVHEVLQAARLDGPAPVTRGVLLGRLACAISWLVWDGQEDGHITLPAVFFVRLAEFLGPLARELRNEETAAL